MPTKSQLIQSLREKEKFLYKQNEYLGDQFQVIIESIKSEFEQLKQFCTEKQVKEINESLIYITKFAAAVNEDVYYCDHQKISSMIGIALAYIDPKEGSFF